MAAARHSQYPSKNGNPIVLLVEDDIQARLLTAEYLRDVGFTVIEAADAAEALAVLTAGAEIDVVFTDVQMPGALDGYGLARWVDEHFPAVPVLITSARFDIQAEERQANGGRFIAKPYIFADMEKRLRHLIED